MKIRNGFVSNSSSSSFLIVGVNKNILTVDQVQSALDDGLFLCEKEANDYIGEEWYISEYETRNFSWEDIRRVADKVKKILGNDTSIEVITGMENSNG